MKLSVGMSWKSGVAAEVIGIPAFSIGEQLYMSKIHLDTAGVLAWTVVIILISMLCEKLFIKLWRGFLEWQPKCRGSAGVGEYIQKEDCVQVVLHLSEIYKSYGKKQLFTGLSAEYKKGKVYYFRMPSGCGKTTLFRMISGLEMQNEGKILRKGKVAYAFQEDRLCEAYSAIKNLELICGSTLESRRYLVPLLAEEDIHKPCYQLSGGMKRRVEVARAFAAQREIVLLDEPFAGLDEENCKKMQEYIANQGRDKVVLIATHV